MMLTTIANKYIECKQEEISSFQPDLEGCVILFKNGKKVFVKNRYGTNGKGLLSIQQQTGFDLNKRHKKSEYATRHNKVNQPGRPEL